jgi:catechol 2,3-dioxygenase-like lactoylglutathione lyase family enzyme
MLADYPVLTTLPATDLERAKRFYADKLALTPENEWPGSLLYRCGANTEFGVYLSQGQASGSHTQMVWTIEDIEAEVAALKARGVVFEEYDTPDLKTVNSIATGGPGKGAWFRDSEGNLFGLTQFV